MRTNAWITLENNLAISWWNYYKWATADPDKRGEEPPLDNFGKNAVRKLVDLDFAFRCFKKATIQTREWRMLSVYDITDNQLNAGYTQYGDAEEGGDYAVAGKWTWSPGDASCLIDLQWNWRPNQVLLFMPDVCDDHDCTTQSPATEITDVNLLAGQPGREFPQTTVLVG